MFYRTGRIFEKVALLLILVVVMCIPFVIKYEHENPCIEYEQKYRYDPTLKMVRKMKVCTKRVKCD